MTAIGWIVFGVYALTRIVIDLLMLGAEKEIHREYMLFRSYIERTKMMLKYADETKKE